MRKKSVWVLANTALLFVMVGVLGCSDTVPPSAEFGTVRVAIEFSDLIDQIDLWKFEESWSNTPEQFTQAVSTPGSVEFGPWTHSLGDKVNFLAVGYYSGDRVALAAEEVIVVETDQLVELTLGHGTPDQFNPTVTVTAAMNPAAVFNSADIAPVEYDSCSNAVVGTAYFTAENTDPDGVAAPLVVYGTYTDATALEDVTAAGQLDFATDPSPPTFTRVQLIALDNETGGPAPPTSQGSMLDWYVTCDVPSDTRTAQTPTHFFVPHYVDATAVGGPVGLIRTFNPNNTYLDELQSNVFQDVDSWYQEDVAGLWWDEATTQWNIVVVNWGTSPPTVRVDTH